MKKFWRVEVTSYHIVEAENPTLAVTQAMDSVRRQSYEQQARLQFHDPIEAETWYEAVVAFDKKIGIVPSET